MSKGTPRGAPNMRATRYSVLVDPVRDTLQQHPKIAYALLFGSAASETAHAASDLDVAVGLRAGESLSTPEVGALIADLEQASGRDVDLVLLDDAPPGLAYRIFQSGVVLLDRDHPALVQRKVRAILDYLDFHPLEAIAVRGVLAAAARGR